MDRTHLLTLILSATLSVPAMAQTSPATHAGSAGTATIASASHTPLPAKTAIDQAVQVAKAENKTVFVYIGASWCGWCHRLDKVLHSAEVGPIIAEHYVLVPLTALEHDETKALENPGVDSVIEALGLRNGPPMFAFIDANGKEIGSSMVGPNNGNIGCPASPEEIKAFGELLKKTAPRMTEADRTKITDYLTSGG